NTLLRLLLLALVMVSGLETAFAQPARPVRPRLIVLTDIGGDPDDQQSMVRLMLYSSEFEIEGMIASAAGTPGELKTNITRPDLIREIVNAYGQVRTNLLVHRRFYPPTEQLLSVIKSGNPLRGTNVIGPGHDTEASRWIIRQADKQNIHPLNIAVWGGSTDLAQALWRVREDCSPEELKAFLGKLRVYSIAHQDDSGPWINREFPDLFYVLANRPEGQDKRNSSYRGMYLGGNELLTSREWIDENVRKDHGPLGALYPPRTWTVPNPHGALKEGDTASWFYFLPNGLGDSEHPEWGGWGGRFQKLNGQLYGDAPAQRGEEVDPRVSVSRWRPAYQNDFAARMDWCVKPLLEANHPPIAILNNRPGRDVVELNVRSKEHVALSANGSSDRDGQNIQYRWWIYEEAGTYEGPVALRGSTTAESSFEAPRVTELVDIHVILEITDDGKPPLTAFRRAVVHVRP
ncbi:MAG TPA: nucleoside hydrolase-like domain-containing protein, partial [Roseimicrobium sp.]|nr:nucleoside hydrolase-like domain-containing protein [Roseimicrobium sp.]